VGVWGLDPIRRARSFTVHALLRSYAAWTLTCEGRRRLANLRTASGNNVPGDSAPHTAPSSLPAVPAADAAAPPSAPAGAPSCSLTPSGSLARTDAVVQPVPRGSWLVRDAAAQAGPHSRLFPLPRPAAARGRRTRPALSLPSGGSFPSPVTVQTLSLLLCRVGIAQMVKD
jgi:hypothetical protein